MSKFYFNQGFNYDFFVTKPDPFDGFEDLSLVTDAPTIYIYDTKPNRVNAASGGGAPIQTINAWGDVTITQNNGKRIAVAAIDDPDPTSGNDLEEYWLAANYVLADGATSILTLRSFLLCRAGVVSEPISVDPADLEQIFPNLSSYVSNTAQLAFINVAILKTKTVLDIKGYHWAQLRQQNDLQQAIQFLSVSLALRSLIQEPGDRFEVGADTYGDSAKMLIQGIKLVYDTDRDGEPDVNVSKGNYLQVRR